jgi:predicted XRE-type DNA-binding protein
MTMLAMADQLPLKPVTWVGASLKDLRGFPPPVQDVIGYALYLAQSGGKHQDAKVLTGFGASRRPGSHQRPSRQHLPRRLHAALCRDGICLARLPEEIEDRTGNAAPRHGVDQATTARSRTDCQREKAMSNKKRNRTGSRNVFKDIGVPNAEEHLVRAQLVCKIDALLKARGLKQVEAAELFGVRQPDVSKMLRGEFRQFSVERLLRFMLALDQDVGIVVKPHRNRSNAPALQVF